MKEKGRILVVDDNEAGRYALAHCLRQAGHEVLEAGTARQCLELAGKEQCDLFLLDIKLPDTSGIEVCMQLKRDPRTAHIPVIQTSALLTGPGDRAEGLESGADAYLAAPFDPRELMAHVDQLLRAYRAEERFRQTIELNPQIPWTATPEGAVEDFSERWLSLTGQNRQEALGDGWLQLPHPEELPTVQAAWAHAVKTGEPSDIEHRLRTADGTYRWVRSRAFPHRGADGRIVRWYGFTEDIQERVEAQRALRKSEEKYRSLFNALDEGFFVIDVIFDEKNCPVDLYYVEVNAAASRMLGRDYTGMRLTEISPNYEKHWVQTFGKVALTGESVRRESYSAQDKKWYSYYVFRVEEGNSRRVGSIFQDITGRKRTEEVLEAAARLSAENPDGVMRLKGGRVLDYTNPSATALLKGLSGGKDGVPAELSEPAVAALGTGQRRELELPCGGSTYLVNFAPIPEAGYVNLYARDITAGKFAEAALRESELFYRQTLESIPGMVFTTRPDGYCDYASQQWVDYTGVPASGQVGQQWQRLLHPEDRPRAAAKWKAAVEGRAPYDLEYRVRRHDGEYEWFKVIGRPIRNEAGEIVRWFGVAANIHELKRAEDALRQSEELFRAVFESSSDCILVWDREYNYLYANQAAIDHVGTTREKVIGKNIRDGLGHIPDFMRLWMERVDRAFTTGQSFRVQDVATVGARVVHSESQISPIRDAAGQVFAAGVVYRDMTERKQAEEALRANEERLRQATKLVGLCSYTWNPQTGALDGDPGIKPMWGLPPDATISLEVWRAGLHPEDRGWVEDRVLRSMDPGGDGTYEAEYRVNGADGVQRWISVRGCTKFADAKPVLHFGVVVEITERKRAEASLKADLEALMRMHELSRRRLGAEGLEDLLQGIMDAAVAIVGAQRGTLQLLEGESLRIVAQHGHEEPFLDFFAQAEGRASACGEATKRGERVLVPDVESSPLFAGTPSLEVLRRAGVRAVQSTPLMSRNGILLGVLTTQWEKPYCPDDHDLRRLDLLARQGADMFEHARAEAALRESEERFRSLANGTPVMIWVHDEQGGLRFVNRRWREFFGMTIEQVRGGNWKPLVHPEDEAGYVWEFLRCHAERREFHAQARVRRHDGQWRWVESFAAPRLSKTGEYLGMAGSSVDITERKEAEAVLARDKEQLEQLVAERTAKLQELVGELEHFSYTITHDMRAPLRAMRGIAEIMSEENGEWSDDDRLKFTRRIITAAERMDGLITDALHYSKLMRQELPLAPVDPGKLLRGMLETYPEFQIVNAKIEIQENLPRVMGNEAGLTQCFSNLLGNAVKFGKPGQRPKVRVWGQMREGWVRLWVEDEGIGISESMLPRVFDMFSRGSSPQAGTGIGLALVRKAVGRMDGRVGVESELGKGSRFWVELKQGDAMQVQV